MKNKRKPLGKPFQENPKPFFCANYLLRPLIKVDGWNRLSPERTTELKIFDLRKDAINFMSDKAGYIMRCAKNKAKIIFKQNIEFSASEGGKIQDILKSWNENT